MGRRGRGEKGMILEDVSTADGYYDTRRLPGTVTRTMRITTDKGSFETPARVISRNDHIARSDIPLSRELPPELTMDFKVLVDGDVEGLTSDGNVAERLTRRTRQYHSITGRALLRMSVFQPTQAMLNRLSTQAKLRFADAQAEYLQDRLGCGITTYPYLDLAAGDYLQFIDDRYRRAGDSTSLFVLHMSMGRARLERVLDRLGEKGPAVVPLIHSGSARAVPAYDAIRQRLGGQKTAFLACQVPQEEAVGGRAASMLHAECFGRGFDMAAPIQRRSFPPRRGGAPAAAGIKMFSPDTWEIETLADALASRGLRIVDEFNLNEHNEPDRRRITAMLEGHGAADADPRKHRLLRQLARVHEAMSSSAEFDRMREAIRDRALGDGVHRTAVRQLALIGRGAGGAPTYMPDFF